MKELSDVIVNSARIGLDEVHDIVFMLDLKGKNETKLQISIPLLYSDGAAKVQAILEYANVKFVDQLPGKYIRLVKKDAIPYALGGYSNKNFFLIDAQKEYCLDEIMKL